jgi:hypothetical protein
MPYKASICGPAVYKKGEEPRENKQPGGEPANSL